MSLARMRDETDSVEGYRDLLYLVLLTIRRSFLLFTVLLGLLFVLFANFVIKGVFAGIIGLFGLTFIVIGIVGILAYWILRNVWR